MPTLHNAAAQTKKIGLLIIVGIIITATLFWLVGVGKALKEKFYPTPAAPPTVSFGTLPKQVFPPSITTSISTFTIDTLSGNLPSTPDRHAVRKTTQTLPTLLSLKKAKDIVSAAGFNPNGKQLSEWEHEWIEEKEPFRRLTMHILTNNFTLETSAAEIAKLEKEIPPTDEEALAEVERFTSSLGTFPSDVDTQKTKKTYYKISNGTFVEAEKARERKAVRVDFFQANLDDSPVVYPNPPFSTMHFIVGPGADIVSASFFHHQIAGEIATYPIKSAEQAFEELKKGEGYIASYIGENPTAKITNVYLAYYASEQEQAYLMPVFVFEGSDDFIAFIPAVQNEWIETTEATPAP